jgi:hypothetical protein
LAVLAVPFRPDHGHIWDGHGLALPQPALRRFWRTGQPGPLGSESFTEPQAQPRRQRQAAGPQLKQTWMIDAFSGVVLMLGLASLLIVYTPQHQLDWPVAASTWFCFLA